jgi:hypothetical protein
VANFKTAAWADNCGVLPVAGLFELEDLRGGMETKFDDFVRLGAVFGVAGMGGCILFLRVSLAGMWQIIGQNQALSIVQCSTERSDKACFTSVQCRWRAGNHVLHYSYTQRENGGVLGRRTTRSARAKAPKSATQHQAGRGFCGWVVLCGVFGAFWGAQ